MPRPGRWIVVDESAVGRHPAEHEVIGIGAEQGTAGQERGECERKKQMHGQERVGFFVTIAGCPGRVVGLLRRSTRDDTRRRPVADGERGAAGSSGAGARYHAAGSPPTPGIIIQHDSQCAFCTSPRERVRGEGLHALYIRDGFPISPGHTLIIPKRHVQSVFEIKAGEWMEFLVLLDLAKQELDAEFAPEAYNIGINDGPAAGQTIPHLHVHLIPRYPGDRPDPRGGVRWILPEKADYWSTRP